MRLLIVEDEVKLATSLKAILVAENYAVDVAFDGEEGWEKAYSNDYDVMLLDINLPKMDGVSLCKKIRHEGIETSIIMLTARDQVEDKVLGLDAGADDYLIKPFEVPELLARIRTRLRHETVAARAEITLGTLEVNLNSRQVRRCQKEISLSAREYALLEYLVRHQGEIVSKETLLDHVWGEEVDPFSNVVDVYWGYLRKKIDRAFPKEPPLLQTVKGMGYRIKGGNGN